MIIIGLLLLIASLVFAVELVFSNHHHFSDPSVFGQHLGLHSDASLFLVGVITGAAILAGLGLIATGSRRKVAKGRTRRHEHHEAEGAIRERDELAARNQRLQEQLIHEPAPDNGHSDLSTANPPAGDKASGATRSNGSEAKGF